MVNPEHKPLASTQSSFLVTRKTASMAAHLMAGLVVLACGSADHKDPLLLEATSYHQQATKLQQEVEPKIEQIDSLKTAVLAQKMPNALAKVSTLDSLKRAFEKWEENLVEVPGMPHNHSHDHGKHRNGRSAGAGTEHHHHHDATLNDLPADQMRDLQRETLNNIRQIDARLSAVIK